MNDGVFIPLLNIEEGYGLFSKSNYQTRLHRHYAIEAIYCRDGFFDVHTECESHLQVNAVLIPADQPHRFQCADVKCELLFLDPLSPIGRFVTETYWLEARKGIMINPPGLDAFFEGAAFSDVFEENVRERRMKHGMDFRIRRCLDAIYADSGISDLSIPRLSRVSYLSESRLSHLFKAETGISIRQYVLWRRVCRAASKVLAGFSLTEGAYEAGFSDSSHFHKAFLHMFGVNPYAGLKS